MTPSEFDVLYASDLHGHTGFYRELFETARRLGVRAVILGGDLTPHADVAAQARFCTEFWLPAVRGYLEAAASAVVYFIPGNDDWRAAFPEEEARSVFRLECIHGRVVPFLDGFWLAGLASVPITPFGMKDWDRWEEGLSPAAQFDGYRSHPDGTLKPFSFRGREQEESLAVELEAVEREWERVYGDAGASAGSAAGSAARAGFAARAGSAAPLICVFHGPPHGTACDQVARGVHVGSHEVRNFMERVRPVLGLHGHIHESPAVSGRFADRVGPTICVNAGQERGSALHAVWFRLDDVAGTLTHSLMGRAIAP